MVVISRRRLLAWCAVGPAWSSVPALASARTPTVSSVVGDAPLKENTLMLDLPRIAETGNAVPLALSLPSAAVLRWVVIAEKNPRPLVFDLSVGRLAAQSSFTTRVRLGATQTVQALAQTADGMWHLATSDIALTGSACYDGT
jgi:sulfur-oxidizing protein SoxY